MDAMLENMKNTFGYGVRKMFSTNIGVKSGVNSLDKSDPQNFNMSLCSICAMEGSNVPFIIRDICKFISEKSMKLEGIFRLSASKRQIIELREEFESNCDYKKDLLLNLAQHKEFSGHAVAGLLKQFLRRLSEPLIRENILEVALECKSLSDEVFAGKVCSCMSGWAVPHRCTLLFLLSFLRKVAQESENRMSVNSLAVVFGPNVFKLPDGIEGLQAQGIANMAFERLLSCSEILCKEFENESSPKNKTSPRPLPLTPDDSYSVLTPSRRRAPPPPPPKPKSPPVVDKRYSDVEELIKSLECGTEEQNAKELEETKEIVDTVTDSFDEGSTMESVPEPEKNSEFAQILDNSIKRIVHSRLFNSAESSSVSDDAESLMMSRNSATSLLPSATAGRNRGPKNRRKPSRVKTLLNKVQLDNDSEEEVAIVTKNMLTKVTMSTATTTASIPIATVNLATDNTSDPTPMATSSSPITTVMTPDSGCIIDDLPRTGATKRGMVEIEKVISPIDTYIPKLNLRNSLDDEVNVTPPPSGDQVPQLDLSSVVESEDYEMRHRAPHTSGNSPPEKAPPRPAPRTSPLKQVSKKKRRQVDKKSSSQESSPKFDFIITETSDETMEQARDRMIQVLRENRKIAGRPFDISRMAAEELRDEKVSMQRELLKFESKHGRPTTKESRQLMRDVYNRYRAVKRGVKKWKGEADENENVVVPATSQELGSMDSFSVTRTIPTDVTSCDDSDAIIEGSEMSSSQMIQKVNELRQKRRRLRKILRDFETERAEKGMGDGPTDRGALKSEYRQYREIKNNLRTLEIALAKRGIELS